MARVALPPLRPQTRRLRPASPIRDRSAAVPPHRRPSVVLWTFVGALIAVYLVAFGLSAAARLPRPVEFMYGESIVLVGARHVARGEPLYPAPDQLPLTVTAYTPLYYLLVGSLERWFGESYVPGRLVALGSTLAAAAALAWCARRVSGRWLPGFLAAGLFLTQNMTATLWAPLHRVDPLALLFTLLGLALATAGRPRAAVLPLLLAAFTKQTYLVAPLALGLALWPDRRRMASVGGLFLVGLLLGGALTQLLSGGWFLWHTLVANVNPFDQDYLRAILGGFLQFNALPLLAAGALFSLPTRPGERIWRLYFVGCLLTLPMLGKVGASSNYWLELTAASSLLIALLAARLANRPPERAPFSQVGLAGLLVGALLVPLPGYQAVVREALHTLPSGGAGPVKAQYDATPLVAAQPGEVLTDEPGLAIAAGRPVSFEFRIFQLLAEVGLWDERPILEAIEARRFSLVVVTRPFDAPLDEARWTPRVRDALRQFYAPAGQQSGYWLYRPIRAAAVLDPH